MLSEEISKQIYIKIEVSRLVALKTKDSFFLGELSFVVSQIHIQFLSKILLWRKVCQASIWEKIRSP